MSWFNTPRRHQERGCWDARSSHKDEWFVMYFLFCFFCHKIKPKLPTSREEQGNKKPTRQMSTITTCLAWEYHMGDTDSSTVVTDELNIFLADQGNTKSNIRLAKPSARLLDWGHIRWKAGCFNIFKSLTTYKYE